VLAKHFDTRTATNNNLSSSFESWKLWNQFRNELRKTDPSWNHEERTEESMSMSWKRLTRSGKLVWAHLMRNNGWTLAELFWNNYEWRLILWMSESESVRADLGLGFILWASP